MTKIITAIEDKKFKRVKVREFIEKAKIIYDQKIAEQEAASKKEALSAPLAVEPVPV